MYWLRAHCLKTAAARGAGAHNRRICLLGANRLEGVECCLTLPTMGVYPKPATPQATVTACPWGRAARTRIGHHLPITVILGDAMLAKVA